MILSHSLKRFWLLTGRWLKCLGVLITKILQYPIIKRAMHFKFQRANAVRDAFDVIAQAVREIIHRVDAPFIAGVMMRGVTDAIEQRIAQPDVRRRHVNFRPQTPKLTAAHPTGRARIRHGAIAVSKKAWTFSRG